MASSVIDILRYPRPRAREENTALLGMLIFLGSWAMLFAGLFFAYGAVRAGSVQWPPKGLPRLPVLLPLGSTVVIGLSSASLQLGLTRIRRGQDAVSPLFGSLALGTLFLCLQVALWAIVWRSGLSPRAGPYPSVFWGLTTFHALHVLVGLFALALLSIRTAQGLYNPARHLAVKLWALYWHFVGAVWFLIFASVFVF